MNRKNISITFKTRFDSIKSLQVTNLDLTSPGEQNNINITNLGF